jgi:hypothetical protein
MPNILNFLILPLNKQYMKRESEVTILFVFIYFLRSFVVSLVRGGSYPRSSVGIVFVASGWGSTTD